MVLSINRGPRDKKNRVLLVNSEQKFMLLDFMAFHKAQAFIRFSHFLQSEAQVKFKHLPKAARNIVFFENTHIFLPVPSLLKPILHLRSQTSIKYSYNTFILVPAYFLGEHNNKYRAFDSAGYIISNYF